MGVLLMGFKSPVRKLHMETYIIIIRSQLWEGSQPGGGRLGEIGEPMDKNRIMSERSEDHLPKAARRAGTARSRRRRGTSWHHTAKSCGLVAAVNAAVAPSAGAKRRPPANGSPKGGQRPVTNTFLSGEILRVKSRKDPKGGWPERTAMKQSGMATQQRS
jgi:hypothetical protein